jgi:hypothetical protein
MYKMSAVIDARGKSILLAGVFLGILWLCAPAGAHAQAAEGEAAAGATPQQITNSPTLSNDGIFGCLGQGARVANVGTTAAIGGVYVPVNDAAVTLNTGFLVYKECILDGVARKIAESSTAELGAQNLRAALSGRNGAAQFVQNVPEELRRQGNIMVINSLNDSNINTLCPAFKNTVRSAYARSYIQAQNQPNAAFTCSLPTNPTSFWDTLAALRDPKNNAYGASIIVKSQINRAIATNEYNQRERWIINNGFYDATDNPDDPVGGRILTPGYIIAQSLQQVVGSGYRQLENATEIDQVVSNLFGGLTTQLISDTRGLTGLSQASNGQQSYLDRMVSQTAANVRTQAANAALSVIGAARQIEASYRQSKEGMATALSNAITQLRAAENQCWALIVPAVQQYAAAGQTTCVPNGFGGPQTCTTIPYTGQLHIATSTQFSQQIIDVNIAPVATTTIQEIRTSDATLAQLNQLIASVSNSASQSNQQQALLRLDTMVANRQIHTAADANNAATQRDNVVTAIAKLVDDTLKLWGDSPDTNAGWCNVNNPAVIQRWFDAWK